MELFNQGQLEEIDHDGQRAAQREGKRGREKGRLRARTSEPQKAHNGQARLKDSIRGSNLPKMRI
jgi:hypothetical protein